MIVIYPANTVLPSARANTIQILHTANALAQQGAATFVLAKKKPEADTSGIASHYGLDFHPALSLQLLSEPRFLKSPKAQESLLLKKTIQLITHFYGSKKIIFTRDPLFARLLIPLRKVLGFKIVYEAHTLFSETAKETYMPVAWNAKKERRIRKREERIFKEVDGIVFISESLRNFTSERFAFQAPSAVIHDGTSIPASEADKDPSLICYSGQFYSWKGVNTLLEAMQFVKDGKLVLYGGGYSTVRDDLQVMEEIIKRHQLQEKVEIRDFVEPRNLSRTISACSIGAIPLPNSIIANYCNSPLKLFDYLANGLAVVASDLQSIREIITHGENGHLVKPGDPQALADGINRLLSDRQYREKLVTNGRATVRKYSWEERGRLLSGFLRGIL